MFDAGERSDGDGAKPSPSAMWRDSVGVAAVLMLAAEPLAGRSSAELLDLLAGWERQAAWLASRQTELIARIAGQVRAEYEQTRRDAEAQGLPVCFSDQTVENDIEAEVGAALRLASVTAGSRVATAEVLASRLPATQAALAEGKISYWHAVTMVRQTAHLDQWDAREVERKVLPHACRDTIGGLRRRLRRICMAVQPTESSARARQAKDERTVTLIPDEDGMARLEAFGPAPSLQSVFDALDVTAGRAPAEDSRRIGARRFDALIDACVGTLDNAQCPGEPRVRATVYVTMDLPTLLGLRDNPAELHGYGPLPAPLARLLAADNGWRRLIQDAVTGAPKDLGRLRRFPSAQLREWILLRDQVCVFVGCYRAAARCAIDHRIPASADGGTDEANLAPLCPKHHRVKDAGWTYQLHPDRIVWTSPHGLTYTRYLPDPNPTICADLDFLGQNETRRQQTPDSFAGYAPHRATGDQSPDPDPRPPRPRPVGHPDYDPEPPDFEPPDFEPPDMEPPDFEPPRRE
jgi:hypothetical protein